MAWVEEAFVKHPELYARVHESIWPYGEQGAKIFADFLSGRGLSGSRILDVPCGIGRIAVHMAKLGFTVVGVDISPLYIETARKKAIEHGVTDKTFFVIGRMQEVDWLVKEKAPFDVALNVFTSIGYGSGDEDEAFFKALRKVVRDNGLFIISALRNRDYVITHFVPEDSQEMGQLVLIEKRKLDIARSRVSSIWTYYQKKGRDLEFIGEHPVEVRLYSPHEVVALLEKTGWKVLGVYSSLTDEKPYSPEITHYNVTAEAV